ncbi:hypothetical protein PVAND_012593 [Polypedilum vanderplanki]|uniref:Odorant receptor n=1 Tax=Polypedilum vanderplanki TaxID=319348 RepID=A0A9J6CLZ6_POLVA|nr:hypothetical protein PVAND_012593 [Polypedilum vanderplanki]
MVNSSYIFELFANRDFNLEKFTGSFSYVAAILILLIRYSCIFFNKDKIQNILEHFPKEYKIEDLKFHKIDKFLLNFEKFIKTYRILNATAITYAFSSVIFNLIISNSKTFPFEIKFPFDAFKNDFYPFLIVWVFLSYILYQFSILTTENVIYGLITIASVELKLLAAEYKKSKDDTNVIINCIKRQNELYDVIGNIQRIFAPSFFTSFLLSSILICFTAFKCSISLDPAILIFNATFSIISMLQIFIQCFFGQILCDASGNLIDSIYECGWEKRKNEKLKKFLIFVIMRSQKYSAFSLLGVWKINLEQFQSVSGILLTLN